jgi:hypothetical protein
MESISKQLEQREVPLCVICGENPANKVLKRNRHLSNHT